MTQRLLKVAFPHFLSLRVVLVPEQCSRPLLPPKDAPGGVETLTRGGMHDLGQVWRGSGGSFCLRGDDPLTLLVLLNEED